MTSVVSVAVGGELARALAGGGWASVVERVAEGELGSDLALVGVLGSVDPAVLGDGSRVDLVRAVERCRAMVDGLAVRALASVVDATEALGLDPELARHEIGAALGLSASAAAARTEVAVALRDRLPAMLGLVETGVVSLAHGRVLVEAVRDLPDEAAGAVAARVLGRAGSQTVAQFGRAVRRAVLSVDPAGAAVRHEKAKAARTMEWMRQPDGMESIWMTMPASVSTQLWGELTARAKAEQATRAALGLPDPGIDALRVDVLVHAILHNGGADPQDPLRTADAGATGPAGSGPGGSGPAGSGPAGRAGSSGRRRAGRVPRCSCGGAQTAAVVIDLPTLLGLAEHPGEIPGHGPVPAAMARELAWDRDWVRWTVDPLTGALLDRGADTYRPSERLRAFVAARDRVCGFPGCTRPAEQCDCDHVVTFAHHGQTIRVNLGPLCRQHHNAKTHGRWRLSYNPDTGDKTWTSPLGKTYTVSTDPILN